MEDEFLLACLTYQLCHDRPLPAAPEEMDWERLYVLLARHGLTGLFYRLGREHTGRWPEALQSRLRRDYHGAVLWGDRCVQQVAAVLAALDQAGLPVIVLKGWSLIPMVYGGDRGQRTYSDIDLLVSPHQAERAEQIVWGLGYRAKLEPWPGYDRRYGNARAYQLPRDPGPFAQGFAIGMHWGLLDTPLYSCRIPVKDLFKRAEALALGGIEVFTLSAEDHLIYACGHLALHHEYDEALFRYFEMASVVLQAGPAFDWGVVLERASSWRLVIPTQRVLSHLEKLWPGIVPGLAFEEITGLQPTRTEHFVHRLVVENRENHSIRAAVNWLTMPGLGDRMRYALETALPSPVYMRQRYGPAPAGLWPLLYLRRVAAAIRHITQ